MIYSRPLTPLTGALAPSVKMLLPWCSNSFSHLILHPEDLSMSTLSGGSWFLKPSLPSSSPLALSCSYYIQGQPLQRTSVLISSSPQFAFSWPPQVHKWTLCFFSFIVWSVDAGSIYTQQALKSVWWPVLLFPQLPGKVICLPQIPFPPGLY